jgi:hypothetical protein
MKGMTMLSVTLLTFSLNTLATPLPSKEVQKLHAVVNQLDAIRKEAVAKHLDGDSTLGGRSYQSYDQARRDRLDRLTMQELEAELKRLDKIQIDSATRLSGIVLDEGRQSENISGEKTVREVSGFGGTQRRGADTKPVTVGDSVKYGSDMARRFRDMLSNMAPPAHDSREHSKQGYSEPYDPNLEEYVVEMPVAITDSESGPVRVRVNPGKMKILKQKQKLDRLLIDDVLRMTGKLP